MIVTGIRVDDIRDCGAMLLAEHAAECAIPVLGCAVPQWEMYSILEASGRLRILGVFEDDVLTGFASVLLHELPHYGVRAAIVESLFVGSAYRKSGAGTLLLKEVEAFAGQAGCKAVMYSAPVGGKLEAVLDADGKYTRTNAVFCKALA